MLHVSLNEALMRHVSLNESLMRHVSLNESLVRHVTHTCNMTHQRLIQTQDSFRLTCTLRFPHTQGVCGTPHTNENFRVWYT